MIFGLVVLLMFPALASSTNRSVASLTVDPRGTAPRSMCSAVTLSMPSFLAATARSPSGTSGAGRAVTCPGGATHCEGSWGRGGGGQTTPMGFTCSLQYQDVPVIGSVLAAWAGEPPKPTSKADAARASAPAPRHTRTNPYDLPRMMAGSYP